ncbi:MAG TPA: glycosyltransferase [Vicinamibacterales bacterium]|nr:glycosyltransferase [Vicinamibacterales bacterium]
MRLAWFSPFPPVRTGIAGRSAELVEALAARGHTVDRYPESAAHDFVWKRRLAAYDLAVYQFGNSSHHDYEWAYALNVPGLVVLHDTHLHHARAAFLLRERRAADYRAEFRWNHPDVPADAAELAIAGFDSRLYYEWPMVRSLVTASRLTAVHGEGARAELLGALDLPADAVTAIRLGEGEPLTPERARSARAAVRARYGLADDAVVFGCFGGLTPEKRLPQILAAFRATLPHAPGVRLLLAGAAAAHYDVAAGIAAHGLADRVTLTGYLDADADLTDHLAACDVTLNLRWPTARETSGPWLRALAAARPTIITDLVHMGDVPSLDPRSWTVRESGVGGRESGVGSREPGVLGRESDPIPDPRSPITVAIDILDEDHSLRLAMRRLATDAALRDTLGRAAQAWWTAGHSLAAMTDDYERVMTDAAARPAPRVDLPAHMRNAGDRKLKTLMAPLGVEVRL